MTSPASPSQFDMFETKKEPPPQRGGIPRHIPTVENILLVNELKAAGKTQESMAKALGIGTSTLATHYFPSNLDNPPMGRRRHAPTPETRMIVCRSIRGGMAQAKVAKLIGISVPTLRLYYRSELRG